MAGLGYQVADNVTLTAGYRFFDATGDVDIRTHTVEVGVRISQ
jgi:opacity protein-like surface antigen